MKYTLLSLLLAGALAACATTAPQPVAAGNVEALSLLGEPLQRPEIAAAARARLEQDLAAARAEYEQDPDSADAIIWLGRRTAYLGRYREAVAIFSEGIEKHPHDARMYRHRGHRWITLRETDRAVADLTRAAELIRGTTDQIEPDGAPNRFDIPTSTLHSNIWYHLGLAFYLQGRLDDALDAFRECLDAAANHPATDPAMRSDDMRVATVDWLYMTLRRLDREEEASVLLEPIHAGMRILENHAYHRRLLMYRGEISAGELLDPQGADALQLATQGYGVGNWFLYNGDRERAVQIFRQVLGYGNWPAFGHIAAEAALARLR